jgi:hypothetical protein
MEMTAFDIAISVSILTALLVAVLLPLMMSSEGARATAQKARARRLTDAKMNARLLRLNL